MTPLSRKLRRTVAHPRGSKTLVLVVTMEPLGAEGALIEVREKGRRSGFQITVAALYQMLAQREADRAVAERRAKRAMRRRGR